MIVGRNRSFNKLRAVNYQNLMISPRTHVLRKTTLTKDKKRKERIKNWNRIAITVSLTYSEQICREMNAWYLWAFHGDKNNLFVIKKGVK